VKRYASNYLFINGFGFLKQFITEINEEDYITDIYPLEQERSTTIWLPGVIVILSVKDAESSIADYITEYHKMLDSNEIESIKTYLKNLSGCKLFHLYPFNFEKMIPDRDTTYNAIQEVIR